MFIGHMIEQAPFRFAGLLVAADAKDTEQLGHQECAVGASVFTPRSLDEEGKRERYEENPDSDDGDFASSKS